MNKKKMILGVGNPILTDDAIGPKTVDALKKDYFIPDVTYETAALGGLELVELMNGYDWVVFIDAIKTKDGVPGTIYEFTPEDFKETLHLTNLHDINFLTALKLGAKVGMTTPAKVQILAVEIIEDQVFSNDFTPPLAKRFPEIIVEMNEKIRDFFGSS